MEETENAQALDRCVHRMDVNKISFVGPITRDTMSLLTRELYTALREIPSLRNTAKKPKLYLFLTTDGGDIHAAFAAYDHMLRMHNIVELITVAEGFVASAGTLLLMAGVKRLALPNSAFLFHQLSSGIAGKFKDIKDHTKWCSWLMKKMARVYETRSNLTQKQVKKLLDGEKVMSVKKCIKLGFIDDYY